MADDPTGIDFDLSRWPTVHAAIFLTLRRYAGRLVPCADLIDVIWGNDPDGGPLTANNTIRVYIYRIKEHLKILNSNWKITNIWGIGYRMTRIDESVSDEILISDLEFGLLRGKPISGQKRTILLSLSKHQNQTVPYERLAILIWGKTPNISRRKWTQHLRVISMRINELLSGTPYRIVTVNREGLKYCRVDQK